MTKVLVVGASGYLGAAVADACARDGYDVLALSRTGRATVGVSLAGDVRRPALGLTAERAQRIRDEVTHVVLCFGSVTWDCGPSEAVETHSTAMLNVLRFLRELPALHRVVHVSSVLVLGRAEGTVTNRELYLGQRFRNWYEYGKYCAERHARDAVDLPVRIVRFGPLLGPDIRGLPVDTSTGLPAVFPHLLAGYPVHLARRGEFRCYVGDVSGAAEVVVRALAEPGNGQTWSWFDPRMPTLAEVFREVCRPWGTVPRIVEAKLLGRLTRRVARRVGTVPELTDYAEPWFDLDPRVLDEIPGGPPTGTADYLAETGRALLQGSTRARVGQDG
jgi:nucleoside-diphosphate-sugar epimerase